METVMADIQTTLKKEFENAAFAFDIKKIRAILDTNNGARIRTWLSICSIAGCRAFFVNDDAKACSALDDAPIFR